MFRVNTKTVAMTTATALDAQPLLFDSLPEDESRRRPSRRKAAVTETGPEGQGEGEPKPPRRRAARAERIAAEQVVEAPVPAEKAPVPAEPLPAPPDPVPATLDPAILTNPELAALIRGLSDVRLGYLLVEAARELKRRVMPSPWDEDAEEPAEPHPTLVRAARQVIGELAEQE